MKKEEKRKIREVEDMRKRKDREAVREKKKGGKIGGRREREGTVEENR